MGNVRWMHDLFARTVSYTCEVRSDAESDDEFGGVNGLNFRVPGLLGQPVEKTTNLIGGLLA